MPNFGGHTPRPLRGSEEKEKEKKSEEDVVPALSEVGWNGSNSGQKQKKRREKMMRKIRWRECMRTNQRENKRRRSEKRRSHLRRMEIWSGLAKKEEEGMLEGTEVMRGDGAVQAATREGEGAASQEGAVTTEQEVAQTVQEVAKGTIANASASARVQSSGQEMCGSCGSGRSHGIKVKKKEKVMRRFSLNGVDRELLQILRVMRIRYKLSPRVGQTWRWQGKLGHEALSFFNSHRETSIGLICCRLLFPDSQSLRVSLYPLSFWTPPRQILHTCPLLLRRYRADRRK